MLCRSVKECRFRKCLSKNVLIKVGRFSVKFVWRERQLSVNGEESHIFCNFFNYAISVSCLSLSLEFETEYMVDFQSVSASVIEFTFEASSAKQSYTAQFLGVHVFRLTLGHCLIAYTAKLAHLCVIFLFVSKRIWKVSKLLVIQHQCSVDLFGRLFVR